jgi:hypothetical protein
MRVDALAPRALGLVLLCGACLACRPAAAEPIPVNLDIQYQRVETLLETREFWSRNLDMTYTKRLSPDLQLAGQFRINSLDYVDRPEGSVTPYGSLQLAHRVGGFNASYRPYVVTNSNAITTHQKDAQFSGYLAPPRLPRFDMQWTRRRQEPGDRVPAGTGITRSGRLSHVIGGFEMRAGAGDLVLESDNTTVRTTSQQDWSAGVGYRAARRGWSLHADADFGEVRRSTDFGGQDVNQTSTGLFEFSRRVSSRVDASVNYQYREVDSQQGMFSRSYVTHDGAATWNLRPTRATQLILGGGVRPVTMTSGVSRTLGYLLFSATAQGRVRAGWTGVATAAQTFNRSPDGRSYWVGSYRGGSRLFLTRGLDLDLDFTVTANGDTAARDQRTTRVGIVGITANPLRHFTITGNLRDYRAGATLGQTSSRSLSRGFDVRWQPVTSVELGAIVSRSGALPKGEPVLTTKRYSLRLAPAARFQADLAYASSDQSRQDLSNIQSAAREVWSARALAGFGRRFRLSFGGSLSDPGLPTRTRQADVTLSARLGGIS